MEVPLDTVLDFAKTSRLDISMPEAEKLAGDLEATLVYVRQIDELEDTDVDMQIPEHRNAVREDIVTTETGQYTELMLEQAVAVQDGFIKVKKIM